MAQNGIEQAFLMLCLIPVLPIFHGSMALACVNL